MVHQFELLSVCMDFVRPLQEFIHSWNQFKLTSCPVIIDRDLCTVIAPILHLVLPVVDLQWRDLRVEHQILVCLPQLLRSLLTQTSVSTFAPRLGSFIKATFLRVVHGAIIVILGQIEVGREGTLLRKGLVLLLDPGLEFLLLHRLDSWIDKCERLRHGVVGVPGLLYRSGLLSLLGLHL